MNIRYDKCQGCGKRLKTLALPEDCPPPICAVCNEKQRGEILALLESESKKVQPSSIPLPPKGRLVYPKQTNLAATYWSRCWIEATSEE